MCHAKFGRKTRVACKAHGEKAAQTLCSVMVLCTELLFACSCTLAIHDP